jgi:hypothetical protein
MFELMDMGFTIVPHAGEVDMNNFECPKKETPLKRCFS